MHRFAIALGLLCVVRLAHADEVVPVLPAPFILPELTHPRHRASVDTFLGGLGGVATAVVRPEVELNLFVPRRVFIGVAYPIAFGRPPDLANDSRPLPGNLESHIRAVFTLPSAFEVGFTLDVIAPTASFDRSAANRSVAAAATSLDPTNYGHFLRDRTALRPAGDLRIRRGPIVLQARHGIDILIDSSAIDSASASGRFLGHIGYLLSEELEVAVEGSQNYLFASTSPSPNPFDERYRVRDGHRSSITVGPTLRYSTSLVDVGMAGFTNVGDVASPAANRIFALRVSAAVHFGK